MRKVMTVAMMLLVSLSLALLLSCVNTPTGPSKARMYLLDSSKDEIDVVVNKTLSFKAIIELEDDYFNTANVKEKQSIKDWFVLSDFGASDDSVDYSAKVYSLESTEKSTTSAGRKYNKLVANINLKTSVASESGKINVQIPRTSLSRNAYTKSNKDINVDGAIKVRSSYKEKASLSVSPSVVSLGQDAKEIRVVISIKNGTFVALKAGNLEELENAISVTGSKTFADYFSSDFRVEQISGSQNSFSLIIDTKKEGALPTIAETAVTVKINQGAMAANPDTEKILTELSTTFKFKCDGGSKPTPDPEPDKPTPSAENTASMCLVKALDDLSEDKNGILGKVNEGVSKYIKIDLGAKSGAFNERVVYNEKDVYSWFSQQDFESTNFKAIISKVIKTKKDGKDVATGVVINLKFTPRTSTNKPVSLKVVIPTYDNEKGVSIRDGINEKLGVTGDIKITIQGGASPSPIPTEPITRGDEKEIALYMVKSYSPYDSTIEYDSKAAVPVLKKGVYNDVYFAIELKDGMKFNSNYLASNQRGNFTGFVSGISKDDFDYSVYLIGPRGWYSDAKDPVVVACLHIMPKETAFEGMVVNPTIVLKPQNLYDCKTMILDGSGREVSHDIEVKDKLNMVVEEGNNAGIFFTINRIATSNFREWHDPWTIKLSKVKLKDPKVNLSKYITLKGFAIGRDNKDTDAFIYSFNKNGTGFDYVYDSTTNEIKLKKKYPGPYPCIDLYNDINFTNGFLITIDPSILVVEDGAKLVKNSDILYYCGSYRKWLG